MLCVEVADGVTLVIGKSKEIAADRLTMPM